MLKMNKTVRVMSVFLLLSLLLMPLEPVVAGIDSGQPDVIIAEGGARNTYFPDIVKLQNGDLLVVYYDSTAHAALDGRIAMVRSSDDGATWSTPTTVVDSVYDDRDPSIMQTSDGTLLLSYFVRNRNQNPVEKIGTFVTSSNDNGLTWTSPVVVESKLEPATTSDIVELDNGQLLIPLYGIIPGHWQSKITVVHSNYGTLDFPIENEIEISNIHGTNWAEPAVVNLGGGHLMMMIRTTTLAFQTHSYDNGFTWTLPEQTDMEAQASQLLLLNPGEPNLKLLHMWGDYSQQYASGRPVVGQIIGSDFGGLSERVPVYVGHCWDESYPSSVRLDDGRIFTVYYDACAKYIAGTYSTINDFLDYEAPTTYWDSATGQLDLWRMNAHGDLEITTDMNYNPGYYDPRGPIDGNHSYQYSAAKVQNGEGAYWSIEMDQSYPINKIGIVLKPGYEETANIYLSADGINWGTPVAELDYVVTNEMVFFNLPAPVSAQYAKVEIVRSRGTDILAEFALYIDVQE